MKGNMCMTNFKVEEAKLPYDKCVEIDMEVEEESNNNKIPSRNSVLTTNWESKKEVSKWVGSSVKYFSKVELDKILSVLPILIFVLLVMPIVVTIRFYLERNTTDFNTMLIGLPILWIITIPLIFFTSVEKQIYTLIERKMKRVDYLVPSGAIDCHISYKKLLSIWLFSEFEATYIKTAKGELLFYSENGKLIKKGDDMIIPENHENIKRFCNADNKEKKYLTSQMIDNRFYKISDIITDVPVEHIEK